MLKRLALVALLALGACEPDQRTDTPRAEPVENRSYVAVYFEHEGRLVPEYRPLEGGEPARAIWDLLAAGPSDNGLATAVESSDDLLQAAEPEEGRTLLELSEGFWSAPDEQIYRAAAQIVYSMSSVEGGRAVTLIDGLRPGTVRTPDGGVLPQPLEISDFRPPLVQVVQPVAGATVGPNFPVELNLEPERRVKVSLELEGTTLDSSVVRKGTGRMTVTKAATGPATLVVDVTPDITVEVPLHLVDSQP